MADGCAQPTRTRGILRREPRACLRHTSYKSIDFLPNHNLHGTRQNSKPAGLLSAAPTLTLPHRGRELIGCKNSNSFITIHMRYGSCYLNLPQKGSIPRRGGAGVGGRDTNSKKRMPLPGLERSLFIVGRVATQPTRTQKTGDACLWHTRYGLP